jgi:hypothetical protein
MWLNPYKVAPKGKELYEVKVNGLPIGHAMIVSVEHESFMSENGTEFPGSGSSLVWESPLGNRYDAAFSEYYVRELN